ncbi:MAG: DedA family protein [Patescibacteria group bacterium]|nr:DedA family protein [Patescibacteria group bacterium]MDD5554967.1 DedA family protein [Patescibacteria group bacterium]
MSEFINFFLSLSHNLGYDGIVLLMAIESSFIPFPSEIVIPPAAYLASRGEMNIYLIILAGVIGSLIGAVINYWLAYFLGRALIYKIADHRTSRFFLINSAKIKKSEDFFLRYGNISTLVGRLIPVVRQLISLPAGFARMNFKSFLFYTAFGSGVWAIVLAILGYAFGANQELLAKYYKEISWFFVILAILVAAVIVIRKGNNGNSKSL